MELPIYYDDDDISQRACACGVDVVGYLFKGKYCVPHNTHATFSERRTDCVVLLKLHCSLVSYNVMRCLLFSLYKHNIRKEYLLILCESSIYIRLIWTLVHSRTIQQISWALATCLCVCGGYTLD